jgi:hypothetical protein
MHMNIHKAALALCLLSPLAVQAGEPESTGINAGIRQEMGEARKEVRAELAKARQEMRTENLRIDNSLQFGDHDETASSDLPRAEITPRGDLLIEGEAQAIDAGQRAQLLAYRGQVVEIALAGIEAGERTAEAALDAVGEASWVGLMFSAMTGRLERDIERTVQHHLEPAMQDICRQLPTVMASQQALASSLPQFRPYATLEPADVEDCETTIRQEFATL